MRTSLWSVLLIVLTCAPVRAQGLIGTLSQLFIFTPGQEPLFLGGTADPNNPNAIRLHGNHFVPSANGANGTIIDFLTNSVSSNVANIPVSAASGGATFRFEGGTPVRTSVSAGPIFAERAQTLGRGRLFAGVSHTSMHFTTLRGADLSDLHLVFTHENVNFPGCDSLSHGDCSLMGVPTLENETIDFNLMLDITTSVTSFQFTYGLTDHIDFGVVLPIVKTSLIGHSFAQIVPFGEPPAVHYFAGTQQNPVLQASRDVNGSATGVGDVAARIKIDVHDADPLSVALYAEGRFPTGSEDDLLGAGAFAARGLAVVSARFGAFSPHVNLGYLYQQRALDNDMILATAGFDHLMAPWATLSVDLVSELQVGTSHLTVPGDVVIESPYRRIIHPADIPDIRDDIVNGTVGVKLLTKEGVTIVANGGWPLNRGGLRPNLIWTVGLEYNF